MGLSRLDRRVSDLAGGVPAAVLLAATLVAGCGGSGQATPTLPSAAASVMSAHLRGVGAAATRHDRAGATREIDAFAADVARQAAAGHLSRAAQTALETGIDRARTRIGVEVVPGPAPSLSTPVVSGPPVSPAGPAAPQSPPGPGNSTGDGRGGGKVKGDGGKRGKGSGKGGNGNGNGGD